MDTILKAYLEKSVRVIQNADQVWFMAKDIFEMLDLAWRGADSLWQRQVPKEWTLLFPYKTDGGKQNTWFLNEDCIIRLMQKSVKQSNELENIAKRLGIKVEKIWLRNEVEFMKVLQAILAGSGSNDVIETQFLVGNYRLDGYIKRYNFVIEYDEITHNYNKENDLEREKIVNKLLSTYKDGMITPPIFFRIEMGKEYEAITAFTRFLFEQKGK